MTKGVYGKNYLKQGKSLALGRLCAHMAMVSPKCNRQASACFTYARMPINGLLKTGVLYVKIASSIAGSQNAPTCAMGAGEGTLYFAKNDILRGN